MADALSPVFAALGDPTRRQILHRLGEGEATVAELTRGSGISQPAISRHLRVLEHAGLISRHAAGTARYSRLEAGPLLEASRWLRGYSEFWPEEEQLEEPVEPLTTADGWII